MDVSTAYPEKTYPTLRRTKTRPLAQKPAADSEAGSPTPIKTVKLKATNEKTYPDNAATQQ